MTQQKPRNNPAKSDGALDDAALASVTGGTDAAPAAPTQTLSNLQKKVSDTSSGIVANIK
jgi:hypothetical protein